MEVNYQAMQAEKDSDWYRAAQLWAMIKREEDAEACMLIHKAIKQGDLYREAVLQEAGEEPRAGENPRAWVKWFDKMNEIYKRIFRAENKQ